MHLPTIKQRLVPVGTAAARNAPIGFRCEGSRTLILFLLLGSFSLACGCGSGDGRVVGETGDYSFEDYEKARLEDEAASGTQ